MPREEFSSSQRWRFNVGVTYCTTAAQWVRLYSWTTVLRFLKNCCTKQNEKERKLKLMLKLRGRHCRA
jgi:hypothetical protein